MLAGRAVAHVKAGERWLRDIKYNNFQLYVCFRVNCLYAHALTIFIKDAR
jgi:hypothetical protein